MSDRVTIEHTEACVHDHVIWGECIHDETGQRVDPVYVVKYDREVAAAKAEEEERGA